jgi:hypothetical protein
LTRPQPAVKFAGFIHHSKEGNPVRRKHTLPLAALAGICAFALLTSGAAAKRHHSTQKYATHISITLVPDFGEITGKITSRKDACVSKREVFLNFLGTETPLNPREFASRKGRYFIFNDTPTLPEGTYFTHIKRLELGSHRICKPAQSEVVSNP